MPGKRSRSRSGSKSTSRSKTHSVKCTMSVIPFSNLGDSGRIPVMQAHSFVRDHATAWYKWAIMEECRSNGTWSDIVLSSMRFQKIPNGFKVSFKLRGSLTYEAMEEVQASFASPPTTGQVEAPYRVQAEVVGSTLSPAAAAAAYKKSPVYSRSASPVYKRAKTGGSPVYFIETVYHALTPDLYWGDLSRALHPGTAMLFGRMGNNIKRSMTQTTLDQPSYMDVNGVTPGSLSYSWVNKNTLRVQFKLDVPANQVPPEEIEIIVNKLTKLRPSQSEYTFMGQEYHIVPIIERTNLPYQISSDIPY